MSPVVNSHGEHGSHGSHGSSGGSSAGSSASSGGHDRHDQRRADLLWRVSYTNTLRDVPFDGKCIAYPFEPGRFAEYRPTSMDLTRKFDLLTEPDLGVRIDLVTAAAGGYVADPNPVLAPEDERLLEDEPTAGGPGEKGGLAAKRRRVPWLRRTQYLGTDFQRYGTQTEKGETRIGRRFLTGTDADDMQLYKDRDGQINAIQRTFQLGQQPIPGHHHSRPGVTPVEVMPIFPDFDMWKYPAAQVIFDSDPAPANSSSQAEAAGMDRLSQAMIRGMQDEAGEQFVAYFLPTEGTLRKRKRDVEDGVEYTESEEYEYELIREYNWNVRAPPDRQAGGSRGDIGFAFIFHNDRVVYNELDTRVRLSKRKKPSAANVRSRLIVHYRPFNEVEVAAEKARLSILELPGEDNLEDPGQQPDENEGSNKGDADEAEPEAEPEAEGSESAEGSDSDSDDNSDDD